MYRRGPVGKVPRSSAFRGYRPLSKRGEFDGHTLAFAEFATCLQAREFARQLPQVRHLEAVRKGVYMGHWRGRDAQGADWCCIVPVVGVPEPSKWIVEHWTVAGTSANVP